MLENTREKFSGGEVVRFKDAISTGVILG
jgi:hypothetical protein